MYDQCNFSHISVKMQVLSNVDGELLTHIIIVQNPLKDLLCRLSEMFQSMRSPFRQLCLIPVNFPCKMCSANIHIHHLDVV